MTDTINDQNKALADLKDGYDEKYGFHVSDSEYAFKSRKGIDREIVEQISRLKQEPAWMLDFRLAALDLFFKKPMPTWGGDLSRINFDDIYYYVKATRGNEQNWEDVPADVKYTFDRLGIPEAEQKFLSGTGAQFESEVVYHSIRADLSAKGVIFTDTDSALRDYPEMFREYFGTIIPPADNKFAALNSAVWSGGSFIYVPKGVHVEMPLQAYFRINTRNMGQFERTLIIVDEGASVHYVEGCFPAGEKISLGHTWVNIEAVRPGDPVMDGEGNKALVQSVRTLPFKGDLIEVKPLSAGNTFKLTPEHPVLAIKRATVATKRAPRGTWKLEVDSSKLITTTPDYLPAGQLEAGDFLVFPISRITRENPAYTVDMLRLLGYYLAEGSAYTHKKLKQPVVTWTFHEDEREYIDELKTLIEKITGKHGIEVAQPTRHAVNIVVYSQTLKDLCETECGKGAATKQLSQAIMELPPIQQAQLLETYLNGDGSVYLKRKHTMWRAATASQTLAYQLQEIVARQGHFATINIRKGGTDTILGRTITRRDQYILYWSPDKEQSEVRRAGDHFLVPIKAIERTPFEGRVFNFELTTAPNAYVASGFAVHNCTAPTYTSDSLHSAVVEIIVKPHARARYTTIQNWSPNVFNLVTKRAVAYEHATMEWHDANLGCLAEGSTVTTPDGVKAIEALEVGEEVLAYDDTTGSLCFRKVAAKRFSGNQPVHTVSVGKRQLRVTANHPFYSYVYDASQPRKLGRYKLGYVRADQLKQAIIPRTSLDYGKPYQLQLPSLTTVIGSANQYASDLTATRTRVSKMASPEYTTDDIMWLFGYWIGDGDIQIKPGVTEGVSRWAKVGFSTPKTDRARGRLMTTMTALLDAEPTERSDGHHLAWSSKELADFFTVNGFKGRSNTKRVPQWVWSLPESQRLAFIAGYLDSDGHVKGRHFNIKSVNRELLEDVSSLLVTLGITSRIYTEFDTPREVLILGYVAIAHAAHRLEFLANERFYTHVSTTLRDRAQAAAPSQMVLRRHIGRSTLELGESVEVVSVNVSEAATELVPTWDIEVEGTGNFVSQGFIVHNSKLTMKYPAIHLLGEYAHGEVLSMAFAGKGQHQDAGGKIIHAAPHTSSQIISKSISMHGGRATYRGLLKVYEDAIDSKSNVVCDALLMDEDSRTDTYPSIEIDEQDVTIGHEASVSKVSEEMVFYLMTRGISEEQANAMIVSGFIEPIARELPAEYSIELHRLIQLQMEGSVG